MFAVIVVHDGSVEVAGAAKPDADFAERPSDVAAERIARDPAYPGAAAGVAVAGAMATRGEAARRARAVCGCSYTAVARVSVELAGRHALGAI